MNQQYIESLYRLWEMIIVVSPIAGLGAVAALGARIGGFIVSTLIFNVAFGLLAFLLIWLFSLAH